MSGRRTASWALVAVVWLAWPVAAGQPAEQAETAARLWNYMTSNDRLAHWLFLRASTAEVRTPFGPVTDDPMVLVSCREGEIPLAGTLSVEAHPDEPVPSVFDPRAWWWGLTGTGPPRTYAATVTLGAAAGFETTWELPEATYLIRAEYVARLDAAATTEQLLGTTTTEPLVVRVQGRIGIEARFDVDEAYRARLRQMRGACAGAGETRR